MDIFETCFKIINFNKYPPSRKHGTGSSFPCEYIKHKMIRLSIKLSIIMLHASLTTLISGNEMRKFLDITCEG